MVYSAAFNVFHPKNKRKKMNVITISQTRQDETYVRFFFFFFFNE